MTGRFYLLLAGVVLSAAGCTVRPAGTDASAERRDRRVNVDGSSTLFPVTQAVAEKFQKTDPDVRIVIGASGTGGGFGRFIRGEIDINDASRGIRQDEAMRCRENGISFIELKVALDGIAVVVNSRNDWCDSLTVDELRALWKPGSQVRQWSDLQSGWPEKEIKLYGPDTDSGTFEYFTETICGAAGDSRTDYTPSSDDNMLVRGVAGDEFSLGYFGYAYYAENRDRLKALGVSTGSDRSGAVFPTAVTVESGTYAPLSRPLYMYVNTASLMRPEVADFLRFYLDEGQALINEVGYVRLSSAEVEANRQVLDEAIRTASNGARRE